VLHEGQIAQIGVWADLEDDEADLIAKIISIAAI